MNNKEVEKVVCSVCESSYRLVYDLTETSGYAKFCCFCGEAIEEAEEINSNDKEDREE